MNFGLTVVVRGELYDKDMKLKQSFVKHNLITNAGYGFLAKCLGDSTRPAKLSHIAVGTGTNVPSLTDTALQSELFRKSCDYSYVDNDKFLSLGVTLGAGEATGAITEAGILNASTGGVLFDRVTFPVINKDILDVYRISFTIVMEEVE